MSDRILPQLFSTFLIAFVCLVSAHSSCCKGAVSNEQFCRLALADLADSLVSRLQLDKSGTIRVLPTEERFGEELAQHLAECLNRNGVAVYLGGEADASDQVLRTAIHDLSLGYQRQGGGLFSRSKVKRTFSLTASGTLQANDGRLVRVISISPFFRSDLLSTSEAMLARGHEAFFSPEIPPSFQQRILEPSFVVAITGALVYLFFASR